MTVLILALFAASIALAAKVRTDSSHDREYQIKAAFLYNFIKFVDWPKEKVADSDDPITIGVIGKNPFGKAFEPIKYKKVKGKNIVIKQLKGFKGLKKSKGQDKRELHRRIKALRKCHLLFICSSEKDGLAELIGALKGASVLTVGETPNFLKTGGIIKFLVEKGKLRFEVNLDASDEAELKISSKLLRLAKRVIKEKDQSKNSDKSKNKKKPLSGVDE